MRKKNAKIEKMAKAYKSITIKAGGCILKRVPRRDGAPVGERPRKEWLESTVGGKKIITDARETELGLEIFGWSESVDVLPEHIYTELKLQMLDLHWSKCQKEVEVKNGVN